MLLGGQTPSAWTEAQRTRRLLVSLQTRGSDAALQEINTSRDPAGCPRISERADRQGFLTVHSLELQLEEEEKLAENVVCFSTEVGLHSAIIDLRMCNIKSLQRIDLAKEGSTNYVFKE